MPFQAKIPQDWIDIEFRSLKYNWSLNAWAHYLSCTPEEWFIFLLETDETNPFYRKWADHLFAVDYI